jgi:hypothetical protein
MSIQKRIDILDKLSHKLLQSETDKVIQQAYEKNSWFMPAFCKKSIEAICTQFLAPEKIQSWLKPYCVEDDFSLKKTVGIVCAGNVPLVGFHDILCCYVLGVPVQLKLSSKDEVLMRFVLHNLLALDSEYASKFSFVSTIKNFDAVIATGSATTHRYFEYYFSAYPCILRSNRTSVAVITGKETEDDFKRLADDIFMYFGLGCRNVGKIFVPLNFDVENLLPYFSDYAWIHRHTAYMNNYDYHRTILLLNQIPHAANEFLMIQENSALHSPVATLFFERYEQLESAIEKINLFKDQIQCVVGNLEDMTPFGKTQLPQLNDYADDIDTIGFLLSL